MLSEIEKDLLIEIINIGVGKAASNLSDILKTKVLLDVPSVELMEYKTLVENHNNPSSLNSKVLLTFTGTISGTAELVLSMSHVEKIIVETMGITPVQDEYNEIRKEVISETGNIVLNSVIGYLSNFMQGSVKYIGPLYIEKSNLLVEKYHDLKQDSIVLFCVTNMILNEFAMTSRLNIMLFGNSFETLGKYLQEEIRRYK